MLYNTLRQYEYIVAVAEARSLTNAAEVLHVSQPSLSVAITRVEQKLGQPIFFRRKGAAIEITPYGHHIVDKARNLLRLAMRLEQGPDEMPPLVLGCFEDIAPWYLVPTLEKLRTKFPTNKFQGREGRFSNLAVDLEKGCADFVISYDIGFKEKFERRKIKEILPVAFLSTDHPLSVQHSVELAELANYPLILSDEDLSEGYIRNLFDELHLMPSVAQKTTSLEMMRSMAAHDLGVGISYSHPPNNITYDGKHLVTLPITSPQAAADIVVLWSNLRELDQQFREILDALI